MPESKLGRFLLSYRMFEKDQFVGDPDEVGLLTDYYSVLNHLCAIGNFEKMYLPPFYDASRDVYENQKIYEKKMADWLGIGPGDKALDIGCGRGRVAHHVASYTGAHVTGINVDEEQIKLAKAYAQDTGLLGKRLDFKEANYNGSLPFPDNHFDAVYYVQVLSYSTNLTAFFGEVMRVVKPGGKVAFEDYVLGTEYNGSIPRHVELKKLYEPVLGGVETSHPGRFQGRRGGRWLQCLAPRGRQYQRPAVPPPRAGEGLLAAPHFRRRFPPSHRCGAEDIFRRHGAHDRGDRRPDRSGQGRAGLVRLRDAGPEALSVRGG